LEWRGVDRSSIDTQHSMPNQIGVLRQLQGDELYRRWRRTLSTNLADPRRRIVRCKANDGISLSPARWQRDPTTRKGRFVSPSRAPLPWRQRNAPLDSDAFIRCPVADEGGHEGRLIDTHTKGWLEPRTASRFHHPAPSNWSESHGARSRCSQPAHPRRKVLALRGVAEGVCCLHENRARSRGRGAPGGA